MLATVLWLEKERFMILGMPTEIYIILHVLISLIAISSGLVVMYGMLAQRRLHGWIALFLISAVATSLSGFGFSMDHLLPSHYVGFLSLLVLAVTIPARYVFYLAGPWRQVYVVGAATVLYLNVFVFIAQVFSKVPALQALSPTQKSLPFLLTQFAVLLVFARITLLATRKYQARATRAAAA